MTTKAPICVVRDLYLGYEIFKLAGGLGYLIRMTTFNSSKYIRVKEHTVVDGSRNVFKWLLPEAYVDMDGADISNNVELFNCHKIRVVFLKARKGYTDISNCSTTDILRPQQDTTYQLAERSMETAARVQMLLIVLFHVSYDWPSASNQRPSTDSRGINVARHHNRQAIPL
ncbi:hypothetical protein Tco_0818695 [Tanacetum coccineum]